MAFGPIFAIYLLNQAKQYGFQGNLCTLSRYNLWFTWEQFQEIATTYEFPLCYDPKPEEIKEPSEALNSTVFFKALGFSSVQPIEFFDDAPGNYILDLNTVETPRELTDSADALFDFGTSEHIFHLPNVLAHIGRIVKVGGVVIHHTPANNQYNHGFYQFSPTLYFDYYSRNGWDEFDYKLNMFKEFGSLEETFMPLSADHAWQEKFKTGDDFAMNCFVARKTKDSTVGLCPQQRHCLEGDDVPEEKTGLVT